MFVGREEELKLLEKAYNSPKSELVVLYGRRRIGKSALIEEFARNKKGKYLKFEGLEGERTTEQIKHFVNMLATQLKDEFLSNTSFRSWDNLLSYLDKRVISELQSKKKLILFFDEFQWMSAGQKKLVSLLKYHWDNYWKNKNVMLILCGSIASFIVSRVIKSKALYGRITLEMLLKSLKPNECKIFFRNKRSEEEIIKYLMIFGGIPKYLELIDLNSSFNQNVNNLCFTSNGYMINECDRVFYSQFREKQIYLRIVKFLKERIYTFKQISDRLNLSPGGGLKRYLDNLENAEIISSYSPCKVISNSRLAKYKLSDEYLTFYFKYIEPNFLLIDKQSSGNLFGELCEKKWSSWLGFAFERFCLKNALYLSKAMRFSDTVIDYSPYFGREDSKSQIDLLYVRADKVITVCEIKYYDSEVGTKIIPEVEKKLSQLPAPKGYTIEKALISLYGADKSLKNTQYFHHIVTVNDIL